ncbi:hypothetical protein BKA93DRAFT_46703 [Sparassis latifolia]
MDELLSLERCLCMALSLVRSSTCPINRLPIEILGDIFLLVMRPVKPKHAFIWNSSRLRHTRGLTVLTKVCRHWRDVCTNFPFLWSHISGAPRDADPPIPLFLQRSRPAPLTVYLPANSIPSALSLLELESERSRIQELFVHSFTEVAGLRYSPAPALEHLTLRADYVVPRAHQHIILFDDNVPRLKTLSIHTIDWLPSNHFASITHLCCYFSANHRPYDGPRASDLLAMLAGSSRLEDIVFVFPTFALHPQNCGSRPNAKLDHLQRLALGGMSPTWLSWLFCHVDMPVNVAMRIFQVKSRHIFRTVHVLAQALLQHSSTLLELRGSPTSSSAIFGTTAAGYSTGIRIDVNDEDHKFLHTPSLLSQLCSLRSVQELYIDIVDFTSERTIDLGPLLQFLPSLSKLAYRHRSPSWQLSSSLLRFLKDCLGAEGGDSPCCPDLAVLHVIVGDSHLIFNTVVELAEARADAGIPLREAVVGYEGDGLDGCALGQFVQRVEMRPDHRLSRARWPTVCTTRTHRYWPAW